ncbi:MAG TPA: NUDIX hydrolase [Nocardioides sp.]|nr:NUDIX hydrolase [Nocardioides sp.]
MSLHADAVRVLEAWRAPTPEQDALRERYLGHLAAHSDGVFRECRPDHLTASTLVLSHDRTRVLLTLHAKARQWFQFGGHCEPGDPTLASAALREATEESGVAGLRLDPAPVHLSEHAVPFCGPEGDVHHLDVRFVAVADDDAEHAVSEESLDVAWWPADALPNDDLTAVVALARRQSTSSGGGSRWAAADQPSR